MSLLRAPVATVTYAEILEAAWAEHLAPPFARELGLTPSAPADLRVEPSATSADIEDVLGPPPRLRVVGGGDE